MIDRFLRELTAAWKTGGVLFDTPDGPIYWDFDVERMVFVAGSCTNLGIIREVEMPYDEDLELCEPLERLTEKAKEFYNG